MIEIRNKEDGGSDSIQTPRSRQDYTRITRVQGKQEGTSTYLTIHFAATDEVSSLRLALEYMKEKMIPHI